ncbi:MAG: MoxR family ATPase [Pseudomonadales bacterium]|nr:MoxR family ATPase [Pseudomonadales bacterium]
MHGLINKALTSINSIVLGKDEQARLTLACLLAKGHLLLEDLPGMGKTTLSHTLAVVLGLEYNRIQFTSDLLPADILGVSIFDQNTASFEFRAGPVFAQVILADEINRATPKAQSALLEAMEERQVTVDGVTRELPQPFFVIATQNPSTQMGTFPLPESQLDRFLMKVSLGYPDSTAERELILGVDRRSLLSDLEPVMALGDLFRLQLLVKDVHLSDSIVDYIQRLVHYTRTSSGFTYGLSPRGTLALVNSAQAWAYVDGREHVVPEDVQKVLPSVAEHRLRGSADHTGHEGSGLVQRLLSEVDVVG